MRDDKTRQYEEFIEELLGEVLELREQVNQLRQPNAPVIDLSTRRKQN